VYTDFTGIANGCVCSVLLCFEVNLVTLIDDVFTLSVMLINIAIVAIVRGYIVCISVDCMNSTG
jgi:hypothetical protein